MNAPLSLLAEAATLCVLGSAGLLGVRWYYCHFARAQYRDMYRRGFSRRWCRFDWRVRRFVSTLLGLGASVGVFVSGAVCGSMVRSLLGF